MSANGSIFLPAMGRGNGLSPEAPRPGQTILVAGGAGYIGSVLIPRLLVRGYNVRLLDRLYFGEQSLADFRERIELVVADVRDIPESALDGVDGVINLSGLSNDPTAEFDPEANWQMNAIATETLGRMCVARGIERLVFASSCSLYDGLPPGMHDETADIKPRAAYATSKHYGEQALTALIEAPADLVRGEVFNVLHSNYQIRELAMLVAGSVQLLGRNVRLNDEPAPKLTRDYECSNHKLSQHLGFAPTRSVVEAIS